MSNSISKITNVSGKIYILYIHNIYIIYIYIYTHFKQSFLFYDAPSHLENHLHVQGIFL